MSTDLHTTLFPSDPSHGMLFEQKNGVVYQYDASIKSWLKLASDNVILPLATPIKDGAMSSIDFKKLNRLLLPPPRSTIIGNDCLAPYVTGAIQLVGDDGFVSVNGSLDVQNLNQYGDHISKSYPYQIHQHTYGFDFKLDIQSLIYELERRGQLRLQGKQGFKGQTGEQGDPGPSGIMAGPKGEKGDAGTAPECNISIEPEAFQAQAKPGLRKALVGVRVVQDKIDGMKYALEFDRQAVGNKSASASNLKVQQIDSTWVLAIAALNDESETTTNLECGTTTGQNKSSSYVIYYLDIDSIVSVIETQYQEEIQKLKSKYEQLVTFWIKTMSDLFDQQKAALCCALEKCKSMTKSTSLREHMENVAAAAIGRAKIHLHGRDSKEAVEVSSTRLLKTSGGPDLCENGPPFPQTGIRLYSEDAVNGDNIENVDDSSKIVTLDPIINSSVSTSESIELPQGSYVATIKSLTINVNGRYRGDIRIRYNNGGEYQATTFIDQGKFDSLQDAQNAYEGLSLSFEHAGGLVGVYLPSLNPQQYAGEAEIEIIRSDDVIKRKKLPKKLSSLRRSKLDKKKCALSKVLVSVHRNAWDKRENNSDLNGCVININGQDYIIVQLAKLPPKIDNISKQYLSFYKSDKVYPAIAWPTFDKEHFVELPADQKIDFIIDKSLNDIIFSKINDLNCVKINGNLNNIKFILMPSG